MTILYKTLPGILVLATVTPANAHRLDEYLQATFVTVENHRVKLEMFLTPGVNVLPVVLPDIDSDGNGSVSEAEQSSYAQKVLDDLSLTVDGERLKPQVVSMVFPTVEEMKEGRGDIHLEVNAVLPRKGLQRKLVLENHHQGEIANYQVNGLVSHDPAIRLGAERRNYAQSTYELEFTQADGSSDSARSGSELTSVSYLAGGILLILAWIGLRWRGRVGTTRHARVHAATSYPSSATACIRRSVSPVSRE